MKKNHLLFLAAILTMAAFPVVAGEWHTGATNLCTDCHTMHFSQAHQWSNDLAILAGAQKDGNWLSATGPNKFLLKAPANQLCQQCHDGQGFAPDVVGENFNAASQTQGRSGGGLANGMSGYDAWKGHELDTTKRPPGYDAAATPAGDFFPAGSQLECMSCHTQHGIAGVYRNLGPRALGTTNLPSYVIATTNNPAKDVWINVPTGFVPNTGDPATFAPFYDQANIFYNRVDKTVGPAKTSNGIDTMCAVCHGNFHGAAGDPGIGGSDAGEANGGHEFLRHPTSQEVLNAGSHGTSNITRLKGATTRIKVYTTDYTNFADATPGCVSCHKAHGNKNPFGLIFLNRASTSVNEEGGQSATPENAPGATPYQAGYRSLCGQCHGQGS